MLKRTFDLTASGLGLMFLAPLFVAVAIAIHFDSPGRVFYRQWRVGRGFRQFRIWKFRTMVAGAESLGASITARQDARVTRLGARLRHFKVDELPQLLNVWLGDMSLVGPRPEVPRYVERFESEYRVILSVRPGITDLASLRFRHEAELLASADDVDKVYCEIILPEKLRLAREYIDRASFGFDMQLIWRTIWSALFPAPERQLPV